MLVKPAGAHGTLQISQAPVWTADVQPTVLTAAGADEQMLANYQGVPIWQIPEDAEHTRTYCMTTSDWDRDVNVTEYHVEGPVDAMASWHLTGRVWDVSGWSDASKNPPIPNVGNLPGE